MISIAHNQMFNTIEMHLDAKGADLLIEKLLNLKLRGDHLDLPPLMMIVVCLRDHPTEKSRFLLSSS
jgi:hypothetical protein